MDLSTGKILPKLHGNKKRMEDVLIDLAKFCEMGELSSDKASTGFSSTPSVKRVDTVAFRRSYEKVCDMLDAVRRDQYVSFIQ